MRGKIRRGIKVLIFLLLFPTFALGEAQSNVRWEQKKVKQREIIQEIIKVAIENSPVLKEQKELLGWLEQMFQPEEKLTKLEKAGPGSFLEKKGPFLTLPQVEELKSNMVQQAKIMGEERRVYEKLKKELISELMNKITRILTLKNKKENLEELNSFLKERGNSLERQVKAGLKEMDDLFDLRERIMNVSLKAENTEVELEILKIEIATNFGGEKPKKLLGLLDKL